MRGGNFVPFISAVMRRDTVRSLGCFDEELVTFQDYDLWIRIAARHPVRFRDEVAGAFRWHGANTSGPSRENSARFRRETVHILERALREANAYPKEIRAVAYLIDRIEERTGMTRDRAVELLLRTYLTGDSAEVERIFGVDVWAQVLDASREMKKVRQTARRLLGGEGSL